MDFHPPPPVVCTLGSLPRLLRPARNNTTHCAGADGCATPPPVQAVQPTLSRAPIQQARAAAVGRRNQTQRRLWRSRRCA